MEPLFTRSKADKTYFLYTGIRNPKNLLFRVAFFYALCEDGGMEDPATFSDDQIQQALEAPKSIQIDGLSTTQRDASELIALDKYRAQRKASRSPFSALRVATKGYPEH